MEVRLLDDKDGRISVIEGYYDSETRQRNEGQGNLIFRTKFFELGISSGVFG
jgi:hypothetical protein